MDDAWSAELARRTEPTQRRAQERIARILDATRSLLALEPAEAVTTTAIAAKAGVPVSSIYRYFPNAYAIFAELFRTQAEATNRAVAAIMDDTARLPSWRARCRAVLAALAAGMRAQPSHRPLFQLTRMTRELRAVNERANAEIAAHMARRWKRGLDGFAHGDPALVARTAVEIFTAMEGMAMDAEDEALATRYLDEGARAIEAYLALYLHD